MWYWEERIAYGKLGMVYGKLEMVYGKLEMVHGETMCFIENLISPISWRYDHFCHKFWNWLYPCLTYW